MELRSDTEKWLIGQPITRFTGGKLPSNREVLQLFLFYQSQSRLTKRQCCWKVIQAAEQIWDRACIPVKNTCTNIKALEKLLKQWTNLRKSISRSADKFVQQRKTFSERLDYLFDMAHLNALGMIDVQEDREFLMTQREKGRLGLMMGPYNDACDDGKSLLEPTIEEMIGKRYNKMTAFNPYSKVYYRKVATDGLEESSDDDSDADYEPTKAKQRKVVSIELCKVLDRCGISDRKAMMVVSSVVKSEGHNLLNCTVSTSTLNRARSRVRREHAEKDKELYSSDGYRVVHWDGKLLPDITPRGTGGNVERLSVIVSGEGDDKLLGVPKIDSGTGLAQANAVFECLNDWKLDSHIIGMCFDTTSSNTGVKSGACTLLEEKLGRTLLNLACRHHVLELLAKAAFENCFGTSTSPNVPLFEKFKSAWSSIDKSDFKTIKKNKKLYKSFENSNDIIGFCNDQLKQFQPRDDYREVLQLCVIFLGGTPVDGVTFKKPGAVHRARWMSKILYCLKIFLFHEQFQLTKDELTCLTKFCIFVAKVYVKAWFLAPVPLSAPRNDLELLQALSSHRRDKMWLSAALKFSKHLWYLNPENVALSFFDEEVSTATKIKMVAALERKLDAKSVRRAEVDISSSQSLGLEDFVSADTVNFFQRFNIDTDFMERCPGTWKEDFRYQSAVERLKKLRVVNDNAERAVALITEFNDKITYNEEQKQFLLQVVADHRKNIPNASKHNLK